MVERSSGTCLVAAFWPCRTLVKSNYAIRGQRCNQARFHGSARQAKQEVSKYRNRCSSDDEETGRLEITSAPSVLLVASCYTNTTVQSCPISSIKLYHIYHISDFLISINIRIFNTRQDHIQTRKTTIIKRLRREQT